MRTRFSNIAALLFGLFASSMLGLPEQTDAQIPYRLYARQDSLTVTVNNISSDGELSLRGLSAAFPYPILTTISIIDGNGKPVTGLADTSRWLSPDDRAEIGLPVSAIWQKLAEFHRDNPAFPSDPNLYNQTPTPLFTEVRETTFLPTSTMLVMDASNSMREELDDAKAGARLFVDQMRQADQAGVVIFSRTVKGFQPLTNDKRQLIATINAASNSSGTALYDAILFAIQGIKNEGGRRGVIAYTDGHDNSSSITPTALIDSARTYNLPIFTIALGNDTREPDLQRIARQTGGLFFKAATAKELSTIYSLLSELIQNYYLMAHASPDPARNNTWRTVEISINTPQAQGKGAGQYFVPGLPTPPAADLAVELTSQTDSTIVIDNDTLNVVQAGESFAYRHGLKNLGPARADSATLFHFLPDSVRLVSASLAPATFENNLLTWQLENFEAGTDTVITLAVALAPDIPTGIMELVSQAHITAVNDTLLDNNFDADTVRVLFIEPSRNYDLALTKDATTDTTILIAGQVVPAVRRGEIFGYRVQVRNLGPAVARNFSIWDAIPDSVSFMDFSLAPQSRIRDTYFWEIDSLAVGGELTIDFNAKVSDSLKISPFPLPNQSQVIAENDTRPDNNFASTLVYAVVPGRAQPTTKVDLSVRQIALTDSFNVIGTDTVRFARAGETYEYLITIANDSSEAAQGVVVSDVLPDSVAATSFDFLPESSNRDSLIWRLGYLLPQDSVQLRIAATVAPTMPAGQNLLINFAQASAVNEAPTLLANNTAIDTVFNIFGVQNLQPLIEASPPVVETGNPVAVRVQAREVVRWWDLWVYLADGTIDSAYADAFITKTQLVPNQWLDINPTFKNTRLLTEAEQEDITFELRTRGLFGELKTARATVNVRSSNDFALDRNVFNFNQAEPLGIKFKLSSNRIARLDVYDVAGSHISQLVEAPYQAGWNTFLWNGATENGKQIGSGLYLITLRSGAFAAMKKVIVVR